MSKSIQELLPNKPRKVMIVQGRVSKELVTEVKKIMIKNRFNWNDVLNACLKNFLQEFQEK